MAACTTGVEDPADETSEVAAAVSSPTPIASLSLSGGRVIEFYDFGTAALVSESGAAYQSPALNFKGSIPRDQLVSTWTRLAPDKPVPAALADLQRRLSSLPEHPESDAAALAEVSKSPSPGESGGGRLGSPGGATPQAPVGCNNGCCDFQWLSTLTECKGGYNFSWFLYNYGWSFANSSSRTLYQGLVCSAAGTSQYSVSVGGSGGSWSVPQATYRWFHWSGGSSNMTSTVNSSTNSHLHTYCGGVN